MRRPAEPGGEENLRRPWERAPEAQAAKKESILRRRASPDDRTNARWKILEPVIPPAKQGGSPRTAAMREIVTAIVSLDRTGCQWRALPHAFPPWSTVWGSFRVWRTPGVWQRMRVGWDGSRRQRGHHRRGAEPAGFPVVPGRRVVERTFAWLSTWRRLSRDEAVRESSEAAWIGVSLIRLLLRRPGRPAEAGFASTTQAHAA